MLNNEVLTVTIPLQEYVDMKIRDEHYKHMFRLEKTWSDRISLVADATDVYYITEELMHDRPNADKFKMFEFEDISAMSTDVADKIEPIEG